MRDDLTIEPFTALMTEAYEALSEEQAEILIDDADASCTSGYDNDGSTGYELFSNGFELAVTAFRRIANREDREVFSHDDEGTTIFLVGTRDEVVERIRKVATDNPSEAVG